jgi:DNA repair protein RecO (recombination protein O)
MNRLFRTEGIVLRSIKLNEADKIVIIYSSDYGKIRGIAKGVRKTKSQFGSSMENLTIVKLLLFKGKSINIISQSEIINSFFSQCKDLFRYGLAIHCSEIIDKLSVEEDPNIKLYNLFKNLLLLLRDDHNPILLVESFKWKLVTLLGYQPELKKCIHCHNLVNKEKNYIFDIARGGLSCLKCQEKEDYYKIKITNYHIRLIQRIIEIDLERIHNKKIDQSILSTLSKITDMYLVYHFEVENRSKNFLNGLKLLK